MQQSQLTVRSDLIKSIVMPTCFMLSIVMQEENATQDEPAGDLEDDSQVYNIDFSFDSTWHYNKPHIRNLIWTMCLSCLQKKSP